jgi:DNA-binding transcriptional ArsR family regulator
MKRPETAETHADLFRALSTDSRVRIVQLLSKDTLCVGALSRFTGISAGAVSQHLRILRSAGLVRSERRGYFIHYRLAPGTAGLLRKAVADVLNPKKGARPCVVRTRSAGSRGTWRASPRIARPRRFASATARQRNIPVRRSPAESSAGGRSAPARMRTELQQQVSRPALTPAGSITAVGRAKAAGSSRG